VDPTSVTGAFATIAAPSTALFCPVAKQRTKPGCTGGTSFAAAFVSGTAALIRNPQLTAAKVRARLEQSGIRTRPAAPLLGVCNRCAP
jgi:hypothetical protein